MSALGRVFGMAVAWLLLGAVHAYRLVISPSLAPACRYEPSCSAYASEAIQRHGPWRGSWLALRRVLRCHPLHPGGFDPVPPEVGSGSSLPPGARSLLPGLFDLDGDERAQAQAGRAAVGERALDGGACGRRRSRPARAAAAFR